MPTYRPAQTGEPILGRQRAKRHQAAIFLLYFLATCLAPLIFPGSPVFGEDKKHVLILHSYSRGSESTDLMDAGIRSVLNPRLPDTELHTEYMDARRLPDAGDEDPTSYEIHKPLVWIGLLGIMGLALVIVILAINIHRRQRAEEAVRISEEKYRSLVDNLDVAVYRNFGDQGIFVQANPAMAKIFGYESPEAKERTAELVTANERLNQEIIERKNVEGILRESEERYRLLVSNIPAVVCKGYWNWEVDFFDDKVEELLGYSKEEFNSRRLTWKDIVVEEDLPNMQRIFKVALQTYRHYIREYRVKTKAGGILWLQERGQIICNQKGRVDYISTVFFDVTERRRTEDEFRRASAEIEQLFASITSILLGLTPQGDVWHWNAEAEKVLGLTTAEALGQRIDKLPIEWDASRISDALAGCRKKLITIRLENLRFQSREGKNGFLGITINPIKGESGAISGFILLGRDVTERLILENQLAQAQKLESIGHLAAGIAHEINTPIQYVGDNNRFLRDAFQDLLHLLAEYQTLLAAGKAGAVTADQLERVEGTARELDLEYLIGEIPTAISQSLEGVERVAKIVRAMKDFSHPGTVEKQAVDLNKAIESTITVARNEWKYVAEMVTDLDPSLPPVPCRPDEINQVILNIIINAAHAIADVVGREPAEKGTITIKTRRHGDNAEIAISDSGGGIPEEIRTRIFDPFFTTKEVGKGTGQGLAISHAVIVEKHAGAIDFETALGQGTTFFIRLPMAAAKSGKGIS